VVEGGIPSPYTVSRDSTQTLVLEADSRLTVTAVSPPPGAELEAVLSAWGVTLRRDLGPLASGSIELDTGEYAKFLPGKSSVAIVMRVNGEAVCVDHVNILVDGFGGPIALGMAAATTVAGVTSLASISLMARGGIDVSVDAQAERKKKRGWPCFVPTVKWKSMAISAVFGAVTGFAGAYVFQGLGALVVDFPKAFIAAAAGGAFSVSAGLGLATLISLLRGPGEGSKKTEESN
jgi:hypothetical protein